MQNPKLNILIYPMLSVDNINSDSNYIIIKNICNELIKTNKYNFHLILDLNRNYRKDNLNKQVKIINVPFPKSKRQQVIHFNCNVINKITKLFAFDIIWNNVVEQAHHFKYFNDNLDSSHRMKIFNYHHYPIHRSLQKNAGYLSCLHILYDQLSGSMAADINYFHSKHSYNMLIQEAKDILSLKSVELIKKNSIIKLGGYVDSLKSEKKYDIYTFIYNHRLDGYKNYKDTFDLFDRLWNEKLKFQVILTGGDKDNLNTINKKPYVVIKSFTLHSDYIKELKKCHANTLNSIHETFCISITESILNNQVVILPNRCTFPELVGNNYEYLFDTKEQQYNILKNLIIKNIRTYNYKSIKNITLSNHIKNMDKMFTNMSNYTNDVFDRIKNAENKQKIKKYLQLKTEVEFTKFKSFIHSLNYGGQSMPSIKVKKILNNFEFDYNINNNLYIKK